MLTSLIRFELHWQLRQASLWAGFVVLGGLVFLASVGNIDFGAGDQVNINSPYAIAVNVLMFAALAGFFIPMLAANAALKDHSVRMDELVFTKAVSRRQLFTARYLGALLAANIMFCGVLLGLLLAEFGPFAEPGRLGDFHPEYYVKAWLFLALPSLLFATSLYFLVARLTSSLSATYFVVLLVTAMFPIWQSVYSADTKDLVAPLDTIGIFAFLDMTRYWSLEQRNLELFEMTGPLALNRGLWLLVGAVLMASSFICFKPRMPNIQRPKKSVRFQRFDGARPPLQQLKRPIMGWLFHFYCFELRSSASSLVYIGLIVVFCLNLLLGTNAHLLGVDGVAHRPTTQFMLARINESFVFSAYLIIIYFGAALVHRSKDSGFDALLDVQPLVNAVRLLGHYAVLVSMLLIALLVSIVVALCVQLLHGEGPVDLLAFGYGVLVNRGVNLYLLAGLSVLVATLLPNKYLAMVITTGLILLQQYAGELGVEHHLLDFSIPTAVYTGLNGFHPYLQAQGWFAVFWFLALAVLFRVFLPFYPRGNEPQWRFAKRKFFAGVNPVSISCFVLMLATGTYIYFNTNILNQYSHTDALLANRAQAERLFASSQHSVGLQVTDADIAIDLYPSSQEAKARGVLHISNVSAESVNSLLVRVNPALKLQALTIDGKVPSSATPTLGYYLFEFDNAIDANHQVALHFTTQWLRDGFKNHGESTRLVNNGTFLTPFDLLPSLGFFNAERIHDKHLRQRHGLGPLPPLPDLDDKAAQASTYLGNLGRLNYHAVISTEPNQRVVSSGELINTWEANGRAHFEFLSSHPIGMMFPVLSGDYQKASRIWQGVELAVYFHEDHGTNVDAMLNAMTASMQYYTEQWGSYPHASLSVVEVPGYQANAMSLPGVITMAENHGFDEAIPSKQKSSRMFFTLAHEIAHQWWANQVIAANTQGARLLTETLAQYGAMRVVQRTFGEDAVVDLRGYELDQYFSSRGHVESEHPLFRSQQDHVAYHKGAIVLERIVSLLGEEKLNMALAEFFVQHRHKISDYPTSKALLAQIYSITPPQHKQEIHALLEQRQWFDFSIDSAEMVESKAGFTLHIDLVNQGWMSNASEQHIKLNQEALTNLSVRDEQGTEIYVQALKLAPGESTIEVTVSQKPAYLLIDPGILWLDINRQNNQWRL
ncbi:M1 family aminopeptidase [Aliiglaciecola sp. CAU 1673]|uniref:ABC transporter permease/M1 family aminopeptidase n=1 Tax=Aliiglaciecola sp. CAU 1673 TaxID=3032595 RepID=UPI0023D9A998|nr:M1 family aminopeptidase [Aliiglaciecola sp. CAU 1673]MDF2176733.1 M1 family aminopeptidase [Aliiglaciecola sp. CAU 1673]